MYYTKSYEKDRIGVVLNENGNSNRWRNYRTLHNVLFTETTEGKEVPARLILLEKNPYLGGKMHTARENGFIMETGADSIVARYPSVQ